MCDTCPRFNVKSVCYPTAQKKKQRAVPEDLSAAGIPSHRERCCQDPRLSQTCRPQYFEPSYCMEPDDMTKLVAHAYKQRWIEDHQQWARKCCLKKCVTSLCQCTNPCSPCGRSGGCGVRPSICNPGIPDRCCKSRPEDLLMAGMPSYRPRCCQDSRLMLTCNPRYFEPSYCQESDNMGKLVAHEYKYRWMKDRKSWAKKCCQDQRRQCAQTRDNCESEEPQVERSKRAECQKSA